MNQKEQQFVSTVLDYYRQHGRHELPWRQTTDPYLILVSELMLQQTQVNRVVSKYEAFISTYPNVAILAKARLGGVLRLWQGLGYNRRAKYLHQCAQAVISEYQGTFPQREAELRLLPGIGPYTAAAVCVFAYNQPIPLIETNVRQVYIHHFFKTKKEVTDEMIIKKVATTMSTDDPRIWYSALMDYGTHLKKMYGNNTRKVRGYTKQSKFKGSDREVRGAILRNLVNGPKTNTSLMSNLSQFDLQRVKEQLQALQKDSLIQRRGQGNSGTWQLP